MGNRSLIAAALAAAFLAGMCASAHAGDASVADRLVVEEPTFICLSVEWFIKGDANANASVALAYRKAGDEEWREAMPLWRVDSTGDIEKVPEGQVLFAGSIFNLQQGTTYEMKLTLKDPDGGDAERIITATTRTEPELSADARRRFVVPGDGGGSGTKEDPFKGLKAADEAAVPGDIMQLAPGTYDGPFTFTASGTEGRPIVWLGPPDNSALLRGDGGERTVTADALAHVWFWRLSITNAQYAFVAHESSYIVMRYCHVYDTDNGFTATRNPLKGNVVMDNVFTGWVPWEVNGTRVCYPNTIFEHDGKEYDVTDILAVNVSGEGIVVAFNRMTSWGDGVHGSGTQPKVANDFYGNDISDSADDGIECDFGAQNIRCFENRMTNCFQGITTQPVFGGPVYILRNAQYNNNFEPYKLHNSPHGVLLINNTSVRPSDRLAPMWVHTSAPMYNVMAANNLFVGGDDSYALDITSPLNDVSFDYNGYVGGPFERFAKWNGTNYMTLDDFRKSAGQETNGVIMDFAGLFAADVIVPASPDTKFDTAVNELLLAPGSPAVDAGRAFPGITDGFSGKAPDLGAYELGAKLPHYGPRPEK